ncbi:unnamed protein product [Bemisia tabaci]|uniref:Uncharacterized protein n=1 Tax=Bemisia tabaci TaxID=7038 RepID=A0A9P0EX05_BEMTA|nr:unnamed protein product [Bemisia tabaci]
MLSLHGVDMCNMCPRKHQDKHSSKLVRFHSIVDTYPGADQRSAAAVSARHKTPPSPSVYPRATTPAVCRLGLSRNANASSFSATEPIESRPSEETNLVVGSSKNSV